VSLAFLAFLATSFAANSIGNAGAWHPDKKTFVLRASTARALSRGSPFASSLPQAIDAYIDLFHVRRLTANLAQGSPDR